MQHYDRGHGVLVVLHGHDAEPDGARRWGRMVAPPGWEVVAPGGPRDDAGVRTWFDTTDRGVTAGSLEASSARIGDLVSDLRGATGRPVVVAGHSQGGALALRMALSDAAPDAVVAVSGFWPERDDGRTPEPPATPPEVLVVTRRDDEVVPAFLGVDAGALLDGFGCQVEVVEQAGGHELDAATVVAVRSWLASLGAPPRRVSLGLPVDRVAAAGEFQTAGAIADLAASWERLGFAAAYVTDHPAPDDRWVAGGGHHALEPTVALAAAATATSTLRLHTNVYVLGYRNPFLAAKALTSLDVLSGGRLLLGVAAGYLRTEFEALEVPYAGRGALLEDHLRRLLSIMSGETQTVGSRTVTPEPRPVQRPHPPVWMGGNSAAARRRAVEFADVWAPFPTPGGLDAVTGTEAIRDHDDLAGAISDLHRRSEEHGRADPPEVAFGPYATWRYLEDPDGGLDELVDEVAALADLGVGWTCLSVPGAGRAEVVERATDLAEALGLRADVARR